MLERFAVEGYRNFAHRLELDFSDTRDYRFNVGDPILYFVHDRLIPFVENCSGGTVALLGLFNYYETVTSPSLLFVDEFDAFYHHDLAEKVLAHYY